MHCTREGHAELATAFVPERQDYGKMRQTWSPAVTKPRCSTSQSVHLELAILLACILNAAQTQQISLILAHRRRRRAGGWRPSTLHPAAASARPSHCRRNPAAALLLLEAASRAKASDRS
jgi:hypothetical protein